MKAQFGGRWTALAGEMARVAAAVRAGPDTAARRGAERRFAALIVEARSLRREMYAAALAALVKG